MITVDAQVAKQFEASSDALDSEQNIKNGLEQLLKVINETVIDFGSPVLTLIKKSSGVSVIARGEMETYGILIPSLENCGFFCHETMRVAGSSRLFVNPETGSYHNVAGSAQGYWNCIEDDVMHMMSSAELKRLSESSVCNRKPETEKSSWAAKAKALIRTFS